MLTQRELLAVRKEGRVMGLFFEQAPTADDVSLLARAYGERPPESKEAMNEEALRYLRELREPVVLSVETALEDGPFGDKEARARARRLPVAPASPRFYTRRFLMALLIFFALVGGGTWADVANQPVTAGAVFGFAGGVFGVVTAFLGSEKGS
jgi:hypothetical protein